MDGKQKRFYRKLKRTIKKMGIRKCRRDGKLNLTKAPDEAHECEPTFGRHSSAWLNNFDGQ